MLKKKTIERFLKELASDKPTPGGGSVAALSGAMAAGLCAMVGKLSKKAKAKNCAVKAERLQKVLTDLIDEDVRAYEAVMKAYKMPKATKKQQKERKEKIQEVLKRAAEVPLQTARYSYEVLKLAEILVDEGNPTAISDVGTAALLCGASIKSAVMNIVVNMRLIKDEGFNCDIEKGLEMTDGYAVKVAQISNDVYKVIFRDDED